VLHKAVESGKDTSVRLLLESGPNPRSVDVKTLKKDYWAKQEGFDVAVQVIRE
jgi:hypothetical protein